MSDLLGLLRNETMQNILSLLLDSTSQNYSKTPRTQNRISLLKQENNITSLS